MWKDTKNCKYCGSEIPKKAKICLHCKKRLWTSPVLLFILFIFIAPLILESVLNFNKDLKDFENKTVNETQNKKPEAVKKPVDEETLKANLRDRIEEIKTYNPKKESLNEIYAALILIWLIPEALKETKEHKNEEIRKLASELEKELSKFQSKEFPKLREAYWKELWKTLWEHNVDVKTLWADHWTIEFTWGYFANNKNKLDTYVEIESILEDLRFTRANFKWYKYDKEYTYWEVNGINDNIIEYK